MKTIPCFLKKSIKKSLSQKTKNFLRRLIKPKIFYFLGETTTPISTCHGFDRGTPIDRFYIEDFLEKNKQHIQGTCLELLNNTYTTTFGEERVTESDILDIDVTNKNASIIDDLRNLQEVSDNSYDCLILTQVLQFIDNIDAGIAECHRILKKGGVLLVTLPSLSRIDPISGNKGDYWRFTTASAKYLFRKKFGEEQLTIASRGNVRSGIYFYTGLAQEDIARETLTQDNPDFPLIITVRAIKQ